MNLVFGHEAIIFYIKAPLLIFCFGDAMSRCADDSLRFTARFDFNRTIIVKDIHIVVQFTYLKRLDKLGRSVCQIIYIIRMAALFHDINTFQRLQSSYQYCLAAFFRATY